MGIIRDARWALLGVQGGHFRVARWALLGVKGGHY